MIYWLQQATEAGAPAASSSPSATLTGAIVGAVVGLVGVLIGQVLQQRRHSEDLRQAEQAQITERLTRAIDQLGSEKLEIKLGGIYALERIARDSPERDYSTVMEVLTAYVRQNTPMHSKIKEASEQSEVKSPRADIKAVLDVIGRRQEDKVSEKYCVTLNLKRVNLSGTDLNEVDLSKTNLSQADLRDTKGLLQEQLNTAYGDKDTQLPEVNNIQLSEAILRPLPTGPGGRTSRRTSKSSSP